MRSVLCSTATPDHHLCSPIWRPIGRALLVILRGQDGILLVAVGVCRTERPRTATGLLPSTEAIVSWSCLGKGLELSWICLGRLRSSLLTAPILSYHITSIFFAYIHNEKSFWVLYFFLLISRGFYIFFFCFAGFYTFLAFFDLCFCCVMSL